MARKPRTWLEVAVATGGFRKAHRALLWAHSWATVREALGHDPTVEEVAEWWNESRRTAFREQAAFRQCFPTLDTPAPIFESAQVRARIRKTTEAWAEIEADIKSAKHPNDKSILELGMGEANL